MLTLALKKDAEYDKVGTRIGVADAAGNVSRFPRSHILREQVVALCGLWDVVIHSIIGVTWGIIPLTGAFGLIW